MNDTSGEEKNCPKCDTMIPANAPAGICPACLLGAGLALEPNTGTAYASAATGKFVPQTPEQLAGRIPKVEIIELIGHGGMGAVYRARHLDLDRIVAVKILPTEISNDQSFADRFSREARALAILNHPNIVSVFDCGSFNDQYYFTMEFVDGTNLRHLIDSGCIESTESLDIVRQICDALEYAHSQGVVHRDIKPENILIDTNGRIKIADFGLAKLVNENVEDSLTATRQIMGSLRYMAPEQTRGTKSVDHRADIFSLGVVFYELLTGDLPIGRFQLPSEKAATDSRLDNVVLRALENEPADRYQHASEVNHDIENISNQPILATTRPAVFPPVKKHSSLISDAPKKLSRKAIFGAALFGFALIIALAALVSVFWLSSVNFSSVSTTADYSSPAVDSPPQYEITPDYANITILIFAIPIVVIGFASLVGTPILGILAIRDIRESNGTLFGIRLAVFDILSFPLIALDILLLVAFLMALPTDWFLLLIVGLPMVLLIDFLIFIVVVQKIRQSFAGSN